MVKSVFLYILIIFILFSCADEVMEFKGFTQSELEYLLASEVGKVWERISKEEDGQEILPDDCDMENYLIFFTGKVGDPKPLLYAYNPSICDSLDFCIQYPDFCQADTTLCSENSEFCESLGDGVLFIGSWYAKEPFINNDRSDTLVFDINNKRESIFVTSISSQHATFQYKNRTGSSGGIITEYYTNKPAETE